MSLLDKLGERYVREKRDSLELPGTVYVIYKEVLDGQETGFSFCVDHRGVFNWRGHFSPKDPMDTEYFGAAFGSALKDYATLRSAMRRKLDS